MYHMMMIEDHSRKMMTNGDDASFFLFLSTSFHIQSTMVWPCWVEKAFVIGNLGLSALSSSGAGLHHVNHFLTSSLLGYYSNDYGKLPTINECKIVGWLGPSYVGVLRVSFI